MRTAIAEMERGKRGAAGVSQQYVNDVLKGRREPGESILKALGLERVVSYRRKNR